MVTVEHIGGVDVAHMVGGAVGFRGLHRLGQQGKIRNGRKGAGQMELLCPVGIGAGALSQHQIIHMDVLLNGACGADTDDVLHTEEVKQLVGIDADGGHTHAGGHDGDFDTLVVAGVAVDTTDIVYKNRVFKEVFCNKPGAQGIAGHQNGLAEADFILNIDMGRSRKV